MAAVLPELKQTGPKWKKKLPEDGPNRPKYVGGNIRYFNVDFNILCV
jgi:hypothetical protein